MSPRKGWHHRHIRGQRLCLGSLPAQPEPLPREDHESDRWMRDRGFWGAAHGAMSSAGAQGVVAERVRRDYEAASAALDPNDSAGRTALKARTRAKTPPSVRGYIELVRPGLGPRPGSVGRANVSNAGVNRTAAIIGIGGKALLAASITISVYEVATADDPVREAFVQGAGFAGALGGGVAGGALGSLAGPVGTIAGSLGGAALGGVGGQYAGGAAYDYLFRP